MKVIESTNVTFDDHKISRIDGEEKESLKFENQSELEDSEWEENVQYKDTLSIKNAEDSQNVHEQTPHLSSTNKSTNLREFF